MQLHLKFLLLTLFFYHHHQLVTLRALSICPVISRTHLHITSTYNCFTLSLITVILSCCPLRLSSYWFGLKWRFGASYTSAASPYECFTLSLLITDICHALLLLTWLTFWSPLHLCCSTLSVIHAVYSYHSYLVILLSVVLAWHDALGHSAP